MAGISLKSNSVTISVSTEVGNVSTFEDNEHRRSAHNLSTVLFALEIMVSDQVFNRTFERKTFTYLSKDNVPSESRLEQGQTTVMHMDVLWPMIWQGFGE